MKRGSCGVHHCSMALHMHVVASIVVSCLTATLCLPTMSDLSLLYPMIIPGM